MNKDILTQGEAFLIKIKVLKLKPDIHEVLLRFRLIQHYYSCLRERIYMELEEQWSVLVSDSFR